MMMMTFVEQDLVGDLSVGFIINQADQPITVHLGTL